VSCVTGEATESFALSADILEAVALEFVG